MPPRIDHVSLAVPHLNEAVERFQRLGFEVSPGGPLTGTGMRNVVIRLGFQYLELIALESIRTAASQELAGPPLVGVLERHQGGLIGYSISATQLESAVSKARGRSGIAGISIDGPYTMRRQVPGGEVVWRTALPGGVIWRRPWPALVEWETGEADRARLDPTPAHANGVTGIAGVVVAVANLDTAVTIYRDVLGFDAPTTDEVPALQARRARFAADGGTIELLNGTGVGALADYLAAWGEGPFALTLATSDAARTRLMFAQSGVQVAVNAGLSDRSVLPPHTLYGMRLSVVEQRSASGAAAAGS